MRATTFLVLAGLVGLGFSGCNPSAFNSILDRAPVQSFSPPGASTNSLFVLPLPLPSEPGTTSAARMLVTNKGSSYLGVADFDMDGKVTLTEAPGNVEANIGGSVFGAAVLADNIMVGTPRVGTTDPPGGSASILSFTGTPASGYAFSVQQSVSGGLATSHVGIAVAAGVVTGQSPGDFVVVGDNNVQLVGATGTPGAATKDTCQSVRLSNPADPYAFRPVAVGDVLLGGFDEIMLGGGAKVWFVQYDTATAELLCPTLYLSLGVAASFGSSLEVADFNGDGKKDLAVGMPPDKVVVYFGPLDPLDFGTPPATLTPPAPSVTITNNLGATGFGQRIAAYTVPGMTSSQLLVADPGATAGGRQGAGRILRFNLTGMNATVHAALYDDGADTVLFDSNENADPGVFGSNLGGLMFNTGLCLPGAAVQLVPWATDGKDILTFFNYPAAPPASAQDPRCFALKP
jgi:hypothetical protein